MATADLVSSISCAVRYNEGKEGEKEGKSGEQFHKWMLEAQVFMRQSEYLPHARERCGENNDREEMVGVGIRQDLNRV